MAQETSLQKRLYAGEASAFDELLEQVGDPLYRFLLARMRCSEDAADVLQETFARLVASHRKLGLSDHLKGYVFACARNEMLRWLDRKKKKPSTAIEQEPHYEPDINLDSADWVESVLRHCDQGDQEIIQLKVFSGLTFAEIAMALGVNASTVATRYRRAIEKLESIIQFSREGVGK